MTETVQTAARRQGVRGIPPKQKRVKADVGEEARTAHLSLLYAGAARAAMADLLAVCQHPVHCARLPGSARIVHLEQLHDVLGRTARYDGQDDRVAVVNTLIYFAVGILIQLPGALIIAYFLYKKIWLNRAFRIIFYLPAIISGVVMVAAYRSIVDPGGPLEAIVELFGGHLPPEGLLANSNSATWMIVLFVIWTGFGGNMLLFGGAMARVPIDVLEAARLEGCGPFRELVQIILPLIWPTICTMLIFTFTGIVNSSGPILLFTNGDYETTTINFWIFLKVYGQQGSGAGGEFGIVSATGLCFTLVTVPIILIVRWALERVPTSEY